MLNKLYIIYERLIKMTDTKNMMTDNELDMVVGGNATAFILPGKKEGTYQVIQCSTSGDVDKMKQLLQGGSVDSLQFSGSYSRMDIAGNKLDAYIDILKSRNIDIVKSY